MSLEALQWAWAQGEPVVVVDDDGKQRWRVTMDATPKLVLLALADRADADGRCYPGLDDLVRRTGRLRANVRAAIKFLEGEGLIVRDELGRGKRSTRYQLVMRDHHDPSTEVHNPVEVVHTGIVTIPLQHVEVVHTGIVTTPQRDRHDSSEGSSRLPNHQQPSLNQPPACARDELQARAAEIAGRAGQLHVEADPTAVRSPRAVARWKARELLREHHHLALDLAAMHDVELDVLARALLAGELPAGTDPRGVFVPGAGWCPPFNRSEAS